LGGLTNTFNSIEITAMNDGSFIFICALTVIVAFIIFMVRKERSADNSIAYKNNIPSIILFILFQILILFFTAFLGSAKIYNAFQRIKQTTDINMIPIYLDLIVAGVLISIGAILVKRLYHERSNYLKGIKKRNQT
jgi:heme/copper-type cytochrome/quinol oxidase subunit 2